MLNVIVFDLDQEDASDFIIKSLLQREGDPVGNYQAARMNIESLNGNQVLKNKDQFLIFHNEINEIKTEVEHPFFWEVTNISPNTVTPIATIKTDYDETTWYEEWTVLSLVENETCLIGLNFQVTQTLK